MHPLKQLLISPQLLTSIPVFLISSLQLYFFLALLSVLVTFPLLKRLKYPPGLFLLHVGLYLFLSMSSYNVTHHTFFVPGYGINLDSVNILSSVEIFKQDLPPQNNIAYQIGQIVLTNYPLGGTHVLALVSYLTRLQPYFIYHRVIIYFYLLILFPAYTLISSVIKSKSRSQNLIIWLATLATALNYLSLSVINTAVLGSTFGSVIAFTFITALVLTKNRISRFNHIWLMLLVIGGIYIYSYYTLVYFVLAASVFAYFHQRPARWQPLGSIALAVIIALIIPPLNQSLVRPFVNNIFSTGREVNLFGGMMGHTTGYINPLTSVSLWFGKSDPRDPIPTTFTLILFLGFLGLFIYLIKNNLPNIRRNKFALILLLTSYLLPLLIARFVTQSPYQYFKAFQMISVAIPTIVVLLLAPLNSGLKRFTLTVYLIFTLGSSLYAYKYVAAPPTDSYVEPYKVTPCHLTQTPDNPLNWYDYRQIACTAAGQTE